MTDAPSLLGSSRLFGLDNRRVDRALTLFIVGLVLASRLAAFPASIWEQDEAYFAAAVVDFDPTVDLPHPPWSPLWIAFGKGVHIFGVAPATALQLVSAAFSVWMIFPLTALWSRLIPRRFAVAAAVLFAFLPATWWFSGRAFNGTAATALLVAGLAWLLRRDRTPVELTAGAIASSLAVLVRPQLFPAAVGVLICVGLRCEAAGRRVLVAAFCIPLLVGAVVLVIEAGGIAPLWSAFTEHADRQIAGLSEVDHGFVDSGLSRSLGHPALAAVWLVVFHIGMIRLFRARGWRDLAPLLIGALAPIFVVVQLLSNPMHARYVIPVLALTSGFVVLGLETLLKRWTWPTVAAIVGIAALIVGPQLDGYRTIPSPPVAALDAAITEAEASESALVVDETLHAFWRLRSLEAPIRPLVSLQPVPHGEETSPGLDDEPIHVVDLTKRPSRRNGEVIARFRTEIPLAIRLSQDRFLDISVDR